jgi:hypothetical protein
VMNNGIEHIKIEKDKNGKITGATVDKREE